MRRLALWFYEIMDSDPGASHIRTMHERNLAPIRQLLFEFLSGWLGGAPLYFQATRAPLPHVGTSSPEIGDAERDEWMVWMRTACTRMKLFREY